MIRVIRDKPAVIQALRDHINHMNTALDSIESAQDEGDVIAANAVLSSCRKNISNILTGNASGLLKKYS